MTGMWKCFWASRKTTLVWVRSVFTRSFFFFSPSIDLPIIVMHRKKIQAHWTQYHKIQYYHITLHFGNILCSNVLRLSQGFKEIDFFEKHMTWGPEQSSQRVQSGWTTFKSDWDYIDLNSLVITVRQHWWERSVQQPAYMNHKLHFKKREIVLQNSLFA